MPPKAACRFADEVIAEIAARQHGVIGLSQLVGAGLSSKQVSYRVQRRRLHRIYRGVYAVGHTVLSREAHWMAAVLACGDGAALSHRDAAALYALRPSAATRIDVTIDSRNGRSRRRRIRLHRSPLPAEEVTVVDGIPVTTVARTLLDLAAVVQMDALKRAIKQAERLRLFDLTDVRAVLHRNEGRPGARRLAAALTAHEEPAFTRSDLEDLMLALSRRHGLPKPLVNATVSGYEVDFLWASERLVVETDGREDHLTRHAFEEDRVRDARLTSLGYRVVRFTYRQVSYEQSFVVETLKRLLQPEASISSTR
jgi:very-short-patch-repair endonuclease/predicted transcriptional regulator of viral defense system